MSADKMCNHEFDIELNYTTVSLMFLLFLEAKFHILEFRGSH